jgi:hypothetical protein
MTALRRALLAIWDFVVGDDWRTAAGVVLALVVTALIAHHTRVAAWWITPVAVVALLALSLRRVVRR